MTVDDHMLERLRAHDVTYQDVIAFLLTQHDPLDEPFDKLDEPLSNAISYFISEKDLEHFNSALSWWPEHPDLPPAMQPPTLFELCSHYREPVLGATFFARLKRRADEVAAWAAKHGALTNGETRDEHAARLNRARVARSRARPSASAGKGKDPAVASAYADYMQACADRKAAIEVHDHNVNSAWQHYLAVKSAPRPAGD